MGRPDRNASYAHRGAARLSSTARLDLAILGGLVVDGTGRPGFSTDVGVAGGRVVVLGDLATTEAARRVDATGKVVCPGFIDAHGHSDLTVLSDPHAQSKVQQGVTTEILGNCGLGVAPLEERSSASMVREAIFINDLDPDVRWAWATMAEYMRAVEERGVAMNVAPLAAHVPLRTSVMGAGDRSASRHELSRMATLLRNALTDGAFGFSTGLAYPPASFAPIEELIALGRVVAQADAVFAIHMRSYSDDLLVAVDEALRIGQETGCRIQISHLTAVGRRNWGKVNRALEAIDAARRRGLRVRADIYPYLAGSANLSQLLPTWAQEGGAAALAERLSDAKNRDRVRQEWLSTRTMGWDEILISWVRPEGDRSLVGRSIADIAKERGVEPDAVAMDVLIAQKGLVSMIAFGRSEADLRAVLTHPESIVGSDGLAVDPRGPTGSGSPHPRYYGCYPRLLGRYVREDAVLAIEEAIRKSTGLVAETFGLGDRGMIAEGQAADLVVFDASTIIDQATFTQPHRFPTGIDLVIVNGTIVVDHGRQTSALPGRVLRTV